MDFATLALISAVAVVGPLLALPRRWRLPVVVGELMAGIVLGKSGFDVLHAANPTFKFLADIGFALVMFEAGTRVPIRDPRLRTGLRIGVGRVLAVAVLAVPVAILLSYGFHTGHAPLYIVLLASSSAALVLPIVESLDLQGDHVLQLLPQVAIADAAGIVALALAIDPAHAGRAALGALAVSAASVAVFFVLRYLVQSGVTRRIRKLSEQHKFALELRSNLVILFALAALATASHVSILLAGFGFGLAMAAAGEPRRLAKQLFALTDGFLGPLFFVWLGASLDVRDLGAHPSFILLGVLLGVGAVAVHVAMRVTRQPVAMGALAAAQLGVPVAATTVGTQTNLLTPAEAAALILGALITILAAAVAGVVAAGETREQS